MDTLATLGLLRWGLDRCAIENIERAEMGAPLDCLQVGNMLAWPFDQFRAPLTNEPGEDR